MAKSEGNIFRKAGPDHPIYQGGALITTGFRRVPAKAQPDGGEPDGEITDDESNRPPDHIPPASQGHIKSL